MISEDFFAKDWDIKLDNVTLYIAAPAKRARATTKNIIITDGMS